MKDIIYIDGSVPQWKGNFHTHTTLSDGKEDPDTVINLYKNEGYNFLTVSDHETYFDSDAYDSENFKMLAGIETAFTPNPDDKWLLGKHYFSLHIHGVYDYSVPFAGEKLTHLRKYPRPLDFGVDSWQRQIDYLKSKNLIVFLNHPNWSRIPYEFMLSMQGYVATEVLNYGSEIMECTGFSEPWWDYCLKNGKRVYAIANDDGHRYFGPTCQACGGFTMVSSGTLDKAELCKAIKEGKMYASAGPKIYDMRVEGGVLKMKFSPAQAVRLVTYDRYAPIMREEGGKLMESFEWKLDERIKLIRPEVVGPDGKKAWGQPIYLYDIFEEQLTK